MSAVEGSRLGTVTFLHDAHEYLMIFRAYLLVILTQDL